MPLNLAYGGFVAISNPNGYETVYIKGDKLTDDSVRLELDDTHADYTQVSVRTEGVWNQSGFEVSPEAGIRFGEGFEIGSHGPHLFSKELEDDHTYFHPHIQYNDTESAEAAILPTVEPLITRSIEQPDDTGLLTGTTIAWTETVNMDRFITSIYLDIAVVPTDNVKLTVQNGSLFFEWNYGVESFAVGEYEFTLPGWVNEEVLGDDHTFTLTVDNGGTMSIVADVTNTRPWFAYSYRLEEHQHLAAMEFTNDAMLTDSLSFELVLTTDGNPLFLTPTVELL